MGLETLAHGIKENAEKEAAALLAQAKAEESALLQEARQRVRAAKDQLARETEAALAQAKLRSETRARLDASQRIQDARRQIMDETYSRFRAQLEAQKPKLYPRLFSAAERQIGPPAAVLVSPADAALAKKLFPSATVRTQEMDGGLIAQSADGLAQMDLRFSTLLDHLKSKTLKPVSEALFGG